MDDASHDISDGNLDGTLHTEATDANPDNKGIVHTPLFCSLGERDDGLSGIFGSIQKLIRKGRLDEAYQLIQDIRKVGFHHRLRGISRSNPLPIRNPTHSAIWESFLKGECTYTIFLEIVSL